MPVAKKSAAKTVATKTSAPAPAVAAKSAPVAAPTPAPVAAPTATPVKASKKSSKKEEVVAAPAPVPEPVAAPAPAETTGGKKKAGVKKAEGKKSKQAKKPASGVKKEKKEKKAPKKVKKVVEENPEDDDGHDRHFKLVSVNSEEVDKGRGGRYTLPALTKTGKQNRRGPKDLASKVFSQLCKANEGATSLVFAIQETTRGSNHKVYTYEGKRVKLDNPQEYPIKDKNGQPIMMDVNGKKVPKVIRKEFRNELKAVKKQ